MNANVQRAMDMNIYDNNLIPMLEVGDICNLFDVWDGNGDRPEDSYSYQLDDQWNWINYEFDLEEDSEDLRDVYVKVTGIYLI